MYNPQLETFIRVADAGSFNKAAEQTFITPTAVMKQINLLEADFGIPLFNRTHRGLTLTKAGESLYRDSKYIIQYCRDSIARAQNAMAVDEHVIRIGTSPMTPAQVLVDLWPKIHEICPDIKFQLVPFDNTPENAKEILANLGQNIDIVAGIFDDTLLELRKCKGFELMRAPICCAVSVNHPLAEKEILKTTDLHDENLMLIRRGWSNYVDKLRDDLWINHPQIHIVDFDFYNTGVFNQCENSSAVLMAIGLWAGVHPLLKILPVEWDYTIPFGLLHSPNPTKVVQDFLSMIETMK